MERNLAWSKEVTADKEIMEKVRVFGVVNYDHQFPLESNRAIELSLALGVSGIVVGAAHMGESKEERSTMIRHIRSATDSKIPVLVQGAATLYEVIQALSLSHTTYKN